MNWPLRMNIFFSWRMRVTSWVMEIVPKKKIKINQRVIVVIVVEVSTTTKSSCTVYFCLSKWIEVELNEIDKIWCETEVFRIFRSIEEVVLQKLVPVFQLQVAELYIKSIFVRLSTSNLNFFLFSIRYLSVRWYIKGSQG